jgi:hypothetical protein
MLKVSILLLNNSILKHMGPNYLFCSNGKDTVNISLIMNMYVHLQK